MFCLLHLPDSRPHGIARTPLFVDGTRFQEKTFFVHAASCMQEGTLTLCVPCCAAWSLWLPWCVCRLEIEWDCPYLTVNTWFSVGKILLFSAASFGRSFGTGMFRFQFCLFELYRLWCQQGEDWGIISKSYGFACMISRWVLGVEQMLNFLFGRIYGSCACRCLLRSTHSDFVVDSRKLVWIQMSGIIPSHLLLNLHFFCCALADTTTWHVKQLQNTKMIEAKMNKYCNWFPG